MSKTVRYGDLKSGDRFRSSKSGQVYLKGLRLDSFYHVVSLKTGKIYETPWNDNARVIREQGMES